MYEEFPACREDAIDRFALVKSLCRAILFDARGVSLRLIAIEMAECQNEE